MKPTLRWRISLADSWNTLLRVILVEWLDEIEGVDGELFPANADRHVDDRVTRQTAIIRIDAR